MSPEWVGEQCAPTIAPCAASGVVVGSIVPPIHIVGCGWGVTVVDTESGDDVRAVDLEGGVGDDKELPPVCVSTVPAMYTEEEVGRGEERDDDGIVVVGDGVIFSFADGLRRAVDILIKLSLF